MKHENIESRIQKFRDLSHIYVRDNNDVGQAAEDLIHHVTPLIWDLIAERDAALSHAADLEMGAESLKQCRDGVTAAGHTPAFVEDGIKNIVLERDAALQKLGIANEALEDIGYMKSWNVNNRPMELVKIALDALKLTQVAKG